MSNKFDASKLRIDEITLVNAQINNENGIVKLESEHPLTLDFDLSSAISEDITKVRIIFKCQIKSDTVEINGNFEIAYFFYVENLSELIILHETKEFEMDGDLMASMANIAYSTSRGIIFSRCLGTPFDKVILPVMTTTALLKPFIKA